MQSIFFARRQNFRAWPDLGQAELALSFISLGGGGQPVSRPAKRLAGPAEREQDRRKRLAVAQQPAAARRARFRAVQGQAIGDGGDDYAPAWCRSARPSPVAAPAPVASLRPAGLIDRSIKPLTARRAAPPPSSGPRNRWRRKHFCALTRDKRVI